MIEQELFKKYFLGRDGFVWWVGQIADATKWKTNQPGRRTPTNAEHKGFAERYRVRIMGYHTADNKALSDDDLPWATVMYPVTAGSGGGTASESTQLRQGNFVFGFFMDGEEGQVPVIMGVIGYNEYTAVMRNVPPVPFLPFDGYEKLDQRAQFAVKEQKEKVAGVQVKPPGRTPVDKQPAIQQSVVGQNHSNQSAQEESQKKDGNIPSPQSKPRRDGPNQIKNLQLDIKNAVHKIELITRDLSKFGTEQKGLINKFGEKIQKVMDEATKFVSEKVKWIIKELRKNTVERVNNAVKDTYFLFFPNERPNVKKTQDKALNGISCVFDKITKGLFGLVGNFLKSLVSKIVNTATCVIENFVGGLIGKLTGFLSGALENIMGPLNSLLGIVSQVGAIAGAVAGFKGITIDVAADIFETVKNLLGFFKCEQQPTKSVVDQYSIWQGAGDNGGKGASLKSIFDKAKAVGSQATSIVGQVTSVVGQVTSAVGDATAIASSVGSALNSLDFSDLFSDTCGVGPILCGPPKVSFFGGGGTGAAGNAIISAAGDIIGVDIVSAGSGYIDSPFVSFDDPCGKGRGAVGRVVLNNANGGGSGTGIGLDSTLVDSTMLNFLGAGLDSLDTTVIDTGTTGGTTGTTGTAGGTTGTTGTAGGTAGGTTGTAGGTTGTAGGTTGTTGTTGGTTGTTGTTGGTTGTAGNDGIFGTPIEISLVSPGTDYQDSSAVGTTGGSGTGLQVNIEVVDNPNINDTEDIVGGSIVAVSIYDPGDNYRLGDIVSIDGGIGGTFKIDKIQGPDTAVVSTSNALLAGGVAKVIIIDPGTGYLQTPNGDAGGEGRVWNTKEQTVVRRSTLDYERPLDPGQTIDLNPGDRVTLPIGSSETISDVNGNILETIPGGVEYVVSNVGTITAPTPTQDEIPLSAFPTAGNGQYPVVLELEEVYVVSSGFDYSPEDKIVMEPNFGAVLEPVFDKNGSVSAVKIIKGAEGFTEMPEIFVDTETGYNAELIPVFKVNRVGDLPEDLDKVPPGEKVISVIDCVGKF
jgi:hypothetical protein